MSKEKRETLLALCPLMGGVMDQKDRIQTAFSITDQEADDYMEKYWK